MRDADLLKFIPRRADDWRDTTLINLQGLAFDRLAVTNGATIFELQREEVLRGLEPVVRASLEAYADGVNAPAPQGAGRRVFTYQVHCPNG